MIFRRDAWKQQLERELERALQGVDDVRRIVTLRAIAGATGVSIVKKADGLRHIASEGSLPALAFYRNERTVVVIPWDHGDEAMSPAPNGTDNGDF